MAAHSSVLSTHGTKDLPRTRSRRSGVVNAFMAGAFSGTSSTVLFQPLDLIKTRIQTQSSTCASALGSAVNPNAIGMISSGETASGTAAKPRKKISGDETTSGTAVKPRRKISGGSAPMGLRAGGMLYTASAVVRTDQVKGLWRGLVPSLSRTVPGVGMYFCCLQWLKNTFMRKEAKAWQSILLGASARSLSGIATLPATVVKTRFESGQFQYRSVVHALSSIWKTEGSKGLYSGLAATIVRDAPFSGLYLMFFSEAKKAVKAGLGANELNPGQTFVCGVIGGILASVVTQPADVVKTRVQLYPLMYNGNADAAMSIIKSDGMAGMFRGTVPRTLRRTLMAAMAWTVYEEIMKKLSIK